MFRKKKPLSLRLWHWSNAGIILLLLSTVFLRNTFLSAKNNQEMILSKAQSIGLVINNAQARDLARMLRNELWQWHPIVGFVGIGLLFFRGLILLTYRKLVAKKSKDKSIHYRLVKKSYLLFYVLLAVMGVSGTFMYYDEFFHISRSVLKAIMNIHESLMWYFIIFIIAHIVGVTRAENGADKGIVSDMINGGENK